MIQRRTVKILVVLGIVAALIMGTCGYLKTIDLNDRKAERIFTLAGSAPTNGRSADRF